MGGFESDGLGGSVGDWTGLGREWGGGRSFATGTRFSEVGFCGLRLETESNLVFVTGTWFWVGLGLKLRV